MKNLSQKAAVGGIAVLVPIVLCGAVGMWGVFTLAGGLSEQKTSAALLRAHVHADMLHDAIHADVISALASLDARSHLKLEEATKELQEHGDAILKDLAAEKRVVSSVEEKRALQSIEEPVKAYIGSAQHVLDLARNDPAAAYSALPGFMQQFETLEGELDRVSDVYESSVKKTDDKGLREANLCALVLAAALLTSVLFLLGMFTAMRRFIVKPLQRMTDVMRGLAKGDTSIDVTGQERSDEIGLMATAVQTFKEAMVLNKSREETMLVVNTLAQSLKSLSQGDLTSHVEIGFPGEYEKLRGDYNEAIGRLAETMQAVVSNAGIIRLGAGEISQAADDFATRTEHQAASLEQTAAALDEITATVRKSAQGAKDVHDAVIHARKQADDGGQVMTQAVVAMDAISNSSKEISQILSVIDEIAFQTNLLALNAGIEAARAGVRMKRGRGGSAGRRFRPWLRGGCDGSPRPGAAVIDGRQRDQILDHRQRNSCGDGRQTGGRSGECPDRHCLQSFGNHVLDHANGGLYGRGSKVSCRGQFGGQCDGPHHTAKCRHGGAVDSRKPRVDPAGRGADGPDEPLQDKREFARSEQFRPR